ncbi:S8 family peptidase [Mechercharimyces sp. CAU 1602]|uniref:S8 family peptidase n=1 Tax=Mechercharimyces sp. CAU 1602 TaxID=2973933 RepID=UPI0021615D5B|nr:S8 family peptidase [Mechercharimyces sp. CAU 1602]MCS1350197.1 S8 family peptidase [Mechercharimyces sp. CAU 1602]
MHPFDPSFYTQHGNFTGKVRKIFYLRPHCDLHSYLQEIRNMGGKPVNVLPHLGLVICDFQQRYNEHNIAYHHPYVEYSEPDIQVNISEPYVNSLSADEAHFPWGVKRIGAPSSWEYTSGRGIKVAVIDTGIAADHPAIQENYRGGVNVLSPVFSPYDYNGHGTHVAGIIAGRAQDKGIIGVAPRAHLYAVKAFNRKGSANLSDLLTAINWCIENEMQVVNMSFGMDNMSESLRHAIQTAHAQGIIMVAAAGNRGLPAKVDFPASYPETIAVTATGQEGAIASFSNMGDEVDLAAPGDKIPSAWLNGGMKEMSGTSMAVPHVVGTAALLLRMDPDLSPNQVRDIMRRTAEPINGVAVIGGVHAHRSVGLVHAHKLRQQEIRSSYRI